MFDSHRSLSPPEVIARFDELFERRHPSKTPESEALLGVIATAAREENRAAAAQLTAIGKLFAFRLSRCSETEDWAVDTTSAVAAEVAAALRIGQGLAEHRVDLARAMRERLPKVAAVFAAGDIDMRLFNTVVYRTDLISDRDVLAAVDAQLAVAVTRWPSLTRARLAGKIDRLVAKVDADAVRRRQEYRCDRKVWLTDMAGGVSDIRGALFTPDAHALDKALNALAATVCLNDPRSREQRRADALGALAARADRLGCRCGRTDCAAGSRPAASPVLIQVIAEAATVAGTGDTPGSLLEADGLIPPEVIAELAISATLMPLVHPGDAPPEPGYRPSRALADYVRCRDLTCRWPGCDCPAVFCDIDHTVPYSRGGRTHASNLKLYCRTHHLVKSFWDWQEKQLPDGTLILTSPSGQTYVTTPGSALLFPSLCGAVGAIPSAEADQPVEPSGDRTAKMPRRRRTRAQDRANRVAAERKHNRRERQASVSHAAHPDPGCYPGPAPPDDDDPPPF